MKIIEKVLKTKLLQFGCDLNKVTEQLKQINLDLIDNQIAFENEAENYIKVREFTEPTIEIARAIVNYDKFYIQSAVVKGEVNFSTAVSFINTAIPVVDYRLDSSVCIIATTTALNIEILYYNPTDHIKTTYNGTSYENAFSEERNNIVKDYYDAFVENGRVPEAKVKDILSLLLFEYIIDEMAVTGANPKIKMYDNADAYAENITEYKLKYINRKTNRVELAYKPTYIKRLGANVSAGLCSNDPYIKLDNLPECANFPLDTISCYWTNSIKNKKEEVAIYIAVRPYGVYTTYKEYKKNNNKYGEIVNSLALQFQREIVRNVNKEYIAEVLKKLNPELICPSVEVIRDCMDNPADPIDVIRYKFKAISIPEDFESRLYISIEDNIGKRYKYKLTENILDDLTRIGNKLEYTGEDGNVVKKQSVADFNVNAMSAIIRRETIIDFSKISGLLGYIYEDVEYIGTDMLPVPNIEVDFYFPMVLKNEPVMFNGTSFESNIENVTNLNKFNNVEGGTITSTVPGTTYATVKYINSKGEILKENRVTNLFPGIPYVPEAIPIINDSEGREWICSDTQYPSTIINVLPEYNVIELKYVEKFSKVTLTFINRNGEKIRDDVIETIQAGTTYNIAKREHYMDEQGNDWRLITSRPQKLLIKDDESKNNLILVYDLEKETVRIKFLNPNGLEIVKDHVEDVQVGRVFTFTTEKVLIDKDGLGWVYNGTNPLSCVVEAGKENLIEVSYEEYKLPVVVKYVSQDGIVILNDYVEYLQVGKIFTPKYDKDITDFNLKKWLFKKVSEEQHTVSKNEKENELKVIYEPKLANVFIQLVDETGKKIVNTVQKSSQIGSEFSSNYLDEITDNYGRMWEKVDTPKTLVVSENEFENTILIKYKPLISTMVVKFFDDERNELIPSKEYNKQAGTKFVPEVIEKLESPDGRKWFYNKTDEQEYVVKKNIEENIVSIFYERELTDVTLEFLDSFGNSLRDNVTVKAQIGSIFSEKAFNKIEDREGCKWTLESSDPKKMVVKTKNNYFKLLYGEVKALVIVKHINVKTNKSVIDDIVAKVKLGSVFVPNIPEKVFDSDKYQWKFIGDKNLSIVVKENEQENIVLLQYDEALAPVTVKYLDANNNKLRNDIDYELQVGKDIDLKKLDKFIDDKGIGWKIQSTKTKNNKVLPSGNEVINFYEPLISEVITKYLNDKDEEIADAVGNKLQVGKSFKPSYPNRITDMDGKLWTFSKISNEEIKLAENGNMVQVKYVPVYSNVIEKFLTRDGKVIGDDIKTKYQVGVNVKLEADNIYVDKETKKWNFIKLDKTSIYVKEDENRNIVNKYYDPRMSNVVVRVYNDSNVEIAEPKKYSAQVGSIYKATVPNTCIDANTKLGWKLPGEVDAKIKIDEDATKNVLSINYEKYMVSVKDRIVDLEKNIIMPDDEKKLQVGTTYEPKIEKVIHDAEGKEWLYSEKHKKGLLFDSEEQAKSFSNDKLSIVVSENEEKNIVFIKYEPSLEKVVVKYQDNLGNIIAPQEEFDAQIGSMYTPKIKEKIVDSKKTKWVYNPNSKSKIKIDRNKEKNVITLSYEEEKAPVIYNYIDECNNQLKGPKKKLEQIGSICKPEIDSIIEDDQGAVWEYKSSSVDTIEVKDSEKDNVIELTYVPLLVDVVLCLKTRKGDIIGKETEKAQLGSKYKPNVSEKAYDEESRMYKFVSYEPEELTIKEVPIDSTEEVNKFDVMYEPVYSDVITVFQDIDGNKLKDNEVIQLHVGTKYTPKLIQFVKDRKGIEWENISKEVDTIRVMEDSKSNVIKMTFELAKAEVLVRFRDLDGNTIKESEHYQENIGTEFIPKIDEILVDNKNRKWIFSSVDPVKLNVGSINNIINIMYQEKKVPVVIKFETIDGKKLRSDITVGVQEGVNYIPKKNYPILYDENNEMWSYLEFRPSSLLVTDKQAENVIIQVYDNKIKEEKFNNKLENPFANTITEEDKKILEEQEARMKEKQKVKNAFVEKAVQPTSPVEPKKETPKKPSEPEVKFADNNLIELSKTIVLDNSEKKAIIKLNQINKDIISELENFRKTFNFSEKDNVIRTIDSHMQEEKDIIKNSLNSMVSGDKSGKKLSKVLEAIVQNDNAFSKLQERKVILLTDYFINQKISTNEQVSYICERGKNEKELLIMEAKINDNRRGKPELKQIYLELLYERTMLDSYYKTRTKAKDNYFVDEADRNSLGSEIVIMVTNLLPKQAYNLLLKDENITIVQENELDAIINLLTQQQRTTLEKLIDDTKDNKMKKAMQKRLKNIT